MDDFTKLYGIVALPFPLSDLPIGTFLSYAKPPEAKGLMFKRPSPPAVHFSPSRFQAVMGPPPFDEDPQNIIQNDKLGWRELVKSAGQSGFMNRLQGSVGAVFSPAGKMKFLADVAASKAAAVWIHVVNGKLRDADGERLREQLRTRRLANGSSLFDPSFDHFIVTRTLTVERYESVAVGSEGNEVDITGDGSATDGALSEAAAGVGVSVKATADGMRRYLVKEKDPLIIGINGYQVRAEGDQVILLSRELGQRRGGQADKVSPAPDGHENNVLLTDCISENATIEVTEWT